MTDTPPSDEDVELARRWAEAEQARQETLARLDREWQEQQRQQGGSS